MSKYIVTKGGCNTRNYNAKFITFHSIEDVAQLILSEYCNIFKKGIAFFLQWHYNVRKRCENFPITGWGILTAISKKRRKQRLCSNLHYSPQYWV